MVYSLQVLAALVLDFLFGDPRWYPHPVKLIGFVCRAGETVLRKYIENQFIAGVLSVIIVLLTTCGTVYFILAVCYDISVLLGDIASVLLLYTSIAARDLLRHSGEVYHRLIYDSDLEGARKAVGSIVGRDTSSLDKPGICRACIETVAENMVDGITAPFFFAVLFSFCSPFVDITAIGCSAVGAFFYKAINTMDSMIGYKNVNYLEFGKMAAKLDDVVNFLPSRISGFMVIFAAFTLNLEYRGAFKIFLRDRLCHSSPNAGHTEAAVAGALGIRLGGPSSYFGEVINKPYIGNDVRRIKPDDIRTSHKLVAVGSLLFVAIFLGLRTVFFVFNQTGLV